MPDAGLEVLADGVGAGRRIDTNIPRREWHLNVIKAFPALLSAYDSRPLTFFLSVRFWRTAPISEIAMNAHHHGVALCGTRLDRVKAVFKHVVSGECILSSDKHQGCTDTLHRVPLTGGTEPVNALIISIFDAALQCECPNFVLQELLSIYGCPNPALQRQDMLAGIYALRSSTKRVSLAMEIARAAEAAAAREDKLNSIRRSWPHPLSQERKEELIAAFRSATSSLALKLVPCAICGQVLPPGDVSNIPWAEIQSPLLKSSPRRSSYLSIPTPLAGHAVLDGYILEPTGVTFAEGEAISLAACSPCLLALQGNRVPRLALANSLYLGPIPPELLDLSPVEESMIAICRAKCTIVQLSFQEGAFDVSTQQRALQGNVIVFPQRPQFLPTVMPPPLEEVLQYICVVFIGSKLPDKQWFLHHAKPLYVRSNKVRSALQWLKAHNPLYASVVLNEESLSRLPAGDNLLPFYYELVEPDSRRDATTSRYDAQDLDNAPPPSDGIIPFHSVVISNVGQDTKIGELRAAALKHVREKRGGILALPHDAVFASEFDNPSLFPSLYPTLFPYGVGGFEDKTRETAIAFKPHVKHLLSLADTRFQTHHSFFFTAFNIIQRRSMLQSVSFKTRHAWFKTVSSAFNAISSDTAAAVAARLANNSFYDSPRSPQEQQVMSLMNHVQSVTRDVAGSNSGRMRMRNEVRALTFTLGVPAFFVTINPADVYNPIVRFMGGAEIDIDNLPAETAFDYHEQAKLVAQNPFVAARFFNVVMKAFFTEVLGYAHPFLKEFDADSPSRYGVFGVSNGYYCCSEAQGRGTLHGHMVVWVEGYLNPNELKIKLLATMNDAFSKRFLNYLEDCVQTAIPSLPVGDCCVPADSSHPCSVRGINTDDLPTPDQIAKDLHLLVSSCQKHKHRATCFKYDPTSRECRFMLDPSASVLVSTIDPKTGEVTLRHEDGMCNNFNSTIIRCERCNMDVKPIISGEAAKAVMFYITDYITKTQLKSHVAYAALESAMRKLEKGDVNVDGDTDSNVRGKRLLQKCAYEMLSRQELSAPQVASFLMDYEDHFSSHSFRCLFWMTAEIYVNDSLPHMQLGPNPVVPAGEDDDAVSVVDLEEENGSASEDDLPGSSHTTDANSSDNDGSDIDLDDDVFLEQNEKGEITPRASQLRDYIFRGNLFSPVSLWDFVARSCKFSFSKSGKDSLSLSDVQGIEETWAPFDVLTAASASRPSARFLEGHDEHKSSYITLSHPLNAAVPVPIGPALPRRDRPDVREKYCRLMLILFKPWRSPKDLIGSFSSWGDAFEDFTHSRLYTPHVNNILNNMQVFHECKDSRDDHFRNRFLRLPALGAEYEGRDELRLDDMVVSPLAADAEEEGLLEHLRSCRSSANTLTARDENVEHCLQVASQCGMFQAANMSVFDNIIEQQQELNPSSVVDVSRSGVGLEQIWKNSYDDRRPRARKRRKKGDQVEQLDSRTSRVRDRSPSPAVDIVPVIVQPPPTDIQHAILCNVVADKYTLNPKQRLAFNILADRISGNGEQLRMYLGGPAGTGKSRVIDALKELFLNRGEGNRYVLGSYMGIAAMNIGGMTLHSALNLHALSRMQLHGDVHQGLIEFWEGKDWLIIDEVSMISLSLLHQINEALQLARESDKPFGGINIMFAGDFAQLPPVGQRSLYSTILPWMCGLKNGQSSIHGKLLWLSVDTAVELEKPQRQNEDAEARFVQLLSRLRDGLCTDEDYDLLTSRVLSAENADAFEDKESPWRKAPIIVAENAPKDAINEACARQFALDNKRPLYWFHATDFRHGQEIENQDLIEELHGKHSGQTKGRLGRVPLCIGMPVLIAQNYDVAGGVVNGSKGTVKKLRYKPNRRGQKVLTSCIVNIPGCSALQMPHLSADEIPILSDSIEVAFSRYGGKNAKTVRRQQVAIVPAFAMTAHRAQGQTMENVIVDLQSCSSTESAYVMVSRATSLDGLFVLRHFAPEKITGGGLTNTKLSRPVCTLWPSRAQLNTAHQKSKFKHQLSLLALFPLQNRALARPNWAVPSRRIHRGPSVLNKS
ncbi:hypothetical protein D9611_014313 [Ephemerocybe angulata]|uniref:ATP-dependent DNA helicase n=1 Tax=Ephemerocybe angulata TaxID=980116 RepID=A0A8H5FEW3_9AGAR|nr:hypothetical protein D9611_014313 [Tulosesus angulatus]